MRLYTLSGAFDAVSYSKCVLHERVSIKTVQVAGQNINRHEADVTPAVPAGEGEQEEEVDMAGHPNQLTELRSQGNLPKVFH